MPDFHIHFLRALGFYWFHPIESVAAKHYPIKQLVNEIGSTPRNRRETANKP
jgi:hypothetical protein